MESLQNGVATYFQVTPLISMRTKSPASWQSCHSVDADAWCKRALTYSFIPLACTVHAKRCTAQPRAIHKQLFHFCIPLRHTGKIGHIRMLHWTTGTFTRQRLGPVYTHHSRARGRQSHRQNLTLCQW